MLYEATVGRGRKKITHHTVSSSLGSTCAWIVRVCVWMVLRVCVCVCVRVCVCVCVIVHACVVCPSVLRLSVRTNSPGAAGGRCQRR
jgi:hypothetical protein